MRIGVDMLGIQAEGAGGRAMAAYARRLVRALVVSDSSDDFILYGHDEYPRDAIPTGLRATLVVTNFGQRRRALATAAFNRGSSPETGTTGGWGDDSNDSSGLSPRSSRRMLAS